MIYKVKAKYREERSAEFFRRLIDGTISDQKPDGAEIVASMKRAKIVSPGVIEWFEMCFCQQPLEHERATVYDKFLFDFTTEEAEGYGQVDGSSFWDYLATA